jgi:hypothetical protein
VSDQDDKPPAVESTSSDRKNPSEKDEWAPALPSELNSNAKPTAEQRDQKGQWEEAPKERELQGEEPLDEKGESTIEGDGIDDQVAPEIKPEHPEETRGRDSKQEAIAEPDPALKNARTSDPHERAERPEGDVEWSDDEEEEDREPENEADEETEDDSATDPGQQKDRLGKQASAELQEFDEHGGNDAEADNEIAPPLTKAEDVEEGTVEDPTDLVAGGGTATVGDKGQPDSTVTAESPVALPDETLVLDEGSDYRAAIGAIRQGSDNYFDSLSIRVVPAVPEKVPAWLGDLRPNEIANDSDAEAYGASVLQGPFDGLPEQVQAAVKHYGATHLINLVLRADSPAEIDKLMASHVKEFSDYFHPKSAEELSAGPEHQTPAEQATLADVQAEVAKIDQAMSASPLPHALHVHRGLRTIDFMNPPDGDPMKLVGQTQTDKAYMSTSIGEGLPGMLQGAKGELHLDVPAGTPGVWLGPVQHEVLLCRGIQYEITSVQPKLDSDGVPRRWIMDGHITGFSNPSIPWAPEADQKREGAE